MGALVTSAIGVYWSVIPMIPLLFVLMHYRNYYIRSAREIKRIESVGESFAHGINQTWVLIYHK